MKAAAKVLTVGPVPTRKGKWLGIQEGWSYRALAKFRSDDAADEFYKLIRQLSANTDAVAHLRSRATHLRSEGLHRVAADFELAASEIEALRP